jgi:hypothetical protein
MRKYFHLHRRIHRKNPVVLNIHSQDEILIQQFGTALMAMNKMKNI